MPELPDVELNKRHLDDNGIGRVVVEVHAPAPEILRDVSPQALGHRLHGDRLEISRRHGKHLFVRYAGGDWLVMHFGMTGYLESYRSAEDAPKHTDLVLRLDDGSSLAYVAARELGLIGIVSDPGVFIAEQGLGPDVLSLDSDRFRELASGRRGGVKCWLMNQAVMAGIGNVYSDEILFRARIHPKTAVSGLSPSDLDGLFDAVKHVLATAIDAGADPARMPEEFLLPHREEGATCPRCGGRLERLKACGRGAFFCPGCQKRQDSG